MREFAIVVALVSACGGGSKRPEGLAPTLEEMPIVGLERVHLGDSMDTVIAAFPGAQTIDDTEVSIDVPVEGLPATTSIFFDADGVRAVSTTFGEVCDDSQALFAALDARFGPVTIESYTPTWRHGSWVVELECHSADTMGWLGLRVRKR